MITAYPQIPQDLNVEIARGRIPGATNYYTFGEINTTAGVETIVWETGMPATITVPNNIQLTAVSSSALDTQRVRIKYLDGSLNPQVETITLNGTTPVLTVATNIRAIDNIYSIDGPFNGAINFTSGGTRYAYIPGTGMVQYNTTLRRVPAGKRLMISSLYAGSVSGTSSAKTILKLETTFINGDSFASQGIFHPIAAFAIQDNTQSFPNFGVFAVPAGEWVAFTALSDKDATVTAGLFGWLENV